MAMSSHFRLSICLFWLVANSVLLAETPQKNAVGEVTAYQELTSLTEWAINEARVSCRNSACQSRLSSATTALAALRISLIQSPLPMEEVRRLSSELTARLQQLKNAVEEQEHIPRILASLTKADVVLGVGRLACTQGDNVRHLKLGKQLQGERSTVLSDLPEPDRCSQDCQFSAMAGLVTCLSVCPSFGPLAPACAAGCALGAAIGLGVCLELCN